MMLDMPTLMLVLAALAFSSTLVFLLLWLVNRDMPGVSLLFYSSVLSLLSVITNFLATSIGLPEGLSPFVSSSLSLTGGLLIVEGVMLFRGFGVVMMVLSLGGRSTQRRGVCGHHDRCKRL